MNIKKLRLAWRILTKKKVHLFIVEVEELELVNMLTHKNYEHTEIYIGMYPYIFKRLIKDIAKDITDPELIADKGKMQADLNYNDD